MTDQRLQGFLPIRGPVTGFCPFDCRTVRGFDNHNRVAGSISYLLDLQTFFRIRSEKVSVAEWSEVRRRAGGTFLHRGDEHRRNLRDQFFVMLAIPWLLEFELFV